MKILIAVSHLGGGGAERVACSLADSFAEKGYLTELAIQTSLDDVEYCPSASVKLTSIYAPPRKFSLKIFRVLSRLRALNLLIRSSQPDIVIAVQANISIEVGLACIFNKYIVIGCEHNNPQYSVRGRVWKYLQSIAYRRIDMVVALVEGAAVVLRQKYPTTRIETISNPLNFPLPRLQPEISPEQVVREGKKIIFAAGRLVEAKGFDRLITIFCEVAKRREYVDLVIAGTGPLHNELLGLTHRLGIADKVHLVGRVGNIADWYARSSVFAMTSLWEGMPMVMLEAMAHGVPVVSDRFEYGPIEIIQPGLNGFIIPNRDVEEFVEKILLILDDPTTRQSMSMQARNVVNVYGREQVIKKWVEKFDMLTSNRSV